MNRSTYHRDYYAAHRDDMLEKNRAWRTKNRNRLLPLARARAKASRRKNMPKVKPAVLALARRNPRYEEQHGITTYVICRQWECGAKLRTLTEHLRRIHSVSAPNYELEFPGSPLDCAKTRRKKSVNGRRQTRSLRHRARRNVRWVQGHPDEMTPLRAWSYVELLTDGKSVAEVRKTLKRSKTRVNQVAGMLGLSAAPCRYDLGTPVTSAHAAGLCEASGLDVRSFARIFGIPRELTQAVVNKPNDRRLGPAWGCEIVNARDGLISDLAAQKRNWRWGRHNLRGVLRSLLPDLRQKYRLLLAIFRRTARFLQADPGAGIEKWQDWLCDQSRLENAGDLPGNLLFTRFLPFAREISAFVEQKLGALRTGYRPSRLALDALAWRLKTTSVVIGYCGKSEKFDPSPVPREVMARLILGTMNDRLRRGPKPRKTNVWRQGSELHRKNPEMSWPEVARRVTPNEYRQRGPRKAGESMRHGVNDYEAAQENKNL